METPRIAMVTPFVEPVRGGISTFVRGLTDELRQLGVDVFTVSREGAPSSDVTICAGSLVEFFAKAVPAIRRTDPTAIHAHAHWYTLQAASFARESPGQRIVFSFHTAWRSTGTLRRRFVDRLLQRCDYVTFPSLYLSRDFDIHLPAGRMKVIHPGTPFVEADSTRQRRARQELGLSDSAHIVGYVGQFHWREKVRGFRILLEALASPKLDDVELVAAGGGVLLAEARQYARRLRIDKRVHLLGEIPDPRRVYQACDVYCHASLQETLGLAILEAMANGCPIVGFRANYTKETIADGVDGLLALPEVESLSETIARLLDNRALAEQLGRSAQHKARATFSWGRTARQFLALYGVTT